MLRIEVKPYLSNGLELVLGFSKFILEPSKGPGDTKNIKLKTGEKLIYTPIEYDKSKIIWEKHIVIKQNMYI